MLFVVRSFHCICEWMRNLEKCVTFTKERRTTRLSVMSIQIRLFVCLFARSLHSFIHSLSCSLARLLVRSFGRAFFLSFFHLFILPFTHTRAALKTGWCDLIWCACVYLSFCGPNVEDFQWVRCIVNNAVRLFSRTEIIKKKDERTRHELVFSSEGESWSAYVCLCVSEWLTKFLWPIFFAWRFMHSMLISRFSIPFLFRSSVLHANTL